MLWVKVMADNSEDSLNAGDCLSWIKIENIIYSMLSFEYGIEIKRNMLTYFGQSLEYSIDNKASLDCAWKTVDDMPDFRLWNVEL